MIVKLKPEVAYHHMWIVAITLRTVQEYMYQSRHLEVDFHLGDSKFNMKVGDIIKLIIQTLSTVY